MIRRDKAVTTFSRYAITLDHPLPKIFGDFRKRPYNRTTRSSFWDQVHKFLVSPLFLYIQRPT